MSTKDKTRNKLMESMRMTKADPANKTEEADKKVASKPEAAKPEPKKPAPKKQETKKAAPKPEKVTYLPSKRVWPD